MHQFAPPWYRVVGAVTRARGPYIFSCEHASDFMGHRPLHPRDEQWLGTHWALDLGIAELTELLALKNESLAVLSTYSRLLLDANRSLDSTSLIPTMIEGQALECNTALSDAERSERIRLLHNGYHDGLDQIVKSALAKGPKLFVSMHSFTPVWYGQRRDTEIGVLFDRYDNFAYALVEDLCKKGFLARPNEPYSGRTGELMYAATRHGASHQMPYVEFEVRQDLIADSAGRERIAAALNDALASCRKMVIATEF